LLYNFLLGLLYHNWACYVSSNWRIFPLDIYLIRPHIAKVGQTFPQAKSVIGLDNFLHPSSNNFAEPLRIGTFVLENKVVSGFPEIVNYNSKYRLQFTPFLFPILMLELIHMPRHWEKKINWSTILLERSVQISLARKQPLSTWLIFSFFININIFLCIPTQRTKRVVR